MRKAFNKSGKLVIGISTTQKNLNDSGELYEHFQRVCALSKRGSFQKNSIVTAFRVLEIKMQQHPTFFSLRVGRSSG